MSPTLLLSVSIMVMLLIVPLINAIVVRIMVHDPFPGDDPDALDESFLPGNLGVGDFWQNIVPHLIELRDRGVRAALAIAIGTAIGFWLVNSPNLLGKQLPEFMVEQLAPNVTLQAIGVGEIFLSYMRIALVVGVALAMPIVVYQLVAFFAPALLPHEKRIVFIALPFVTELFIAGVAFGWFFTVRAALEFLLGYGQTERISTMPTVDSFMGTVATLLLWNGVIFQLPAVIYLLARIGVVSAQQLAGTRRYAMVVITILAALITPTGDPYNLLLLAVPMYLLYELGIVLARLVPKPPVLPEPA
jgi:sec-independent protein translocase protein TatC